MRYIAFKHTIMDIPICMFTYSTLPLILVTTISRTLGDKMTQAHKEAWYSSFSLCISIMLPRAHMYRCNIEDGRKPINPLKTKGYRYIMRNKDLAVNRMWSSILSACGTEFKI